jgi:hypothetical protein
MKTFFASVLFVTLSLSTVLGLSGCTQIQKLFGVHKEVAPEEVVKQFIAVSASAKQDYDKAKIQDLCSGEMRRAFERMTPEAFRISYLNSNVRVTDIKIINRVIQKDSAQVHYQVTVDNRQGTDATQEINERVVELVRTQGAWYIDAIRLEGSDKIAFTRGMIF